MATSGLNETISAGQIRPQLIVELDQILFFPKRVDIAGQSLNVACSGRRAPRLQDRRNPKRSLIASGIHPEAVLGSGTVARCSTTTRRWTSPLKKAFRKAG